MRSKLKCLRYQSALIYLTGLTKVGNLCEVLFTIINCIFTIINLTDIDIKIIIRYQFDIFNYFILAAECVSSQFKIFWYFMIKSLNNNSFIFRI